MIVEVGDVFHKNVYDCKWGGKTVSRKPDHEGGWKSFEAAKALSAREFRQGGNAWNHFYEKVVQKL